jgi:hypothetical protein
LPGRRQQQRRGADQAEENAYDMHDAISGALGA